MIKNPFFKKYGAYIIAAAIFFVLAYAYCYPVLQGKVLYAGDGINADAAIHEGVAYTEATGDHSWWTGSMFSGMPSYQIGGGEYKSEKMLAPLEAVLHRGHSHTAWVFIIYFFCFFALLRSFGVDKYLAITGAVAIALSSYFVVIIAAGHGGKTSTIALMSVVFAGFHLIFRKKSQKPSILNRILKNTVVTANLLSFLFLAMILTSLNISRKACFQNQQYLRI